MRRAAVAAALTALALLPASASGGTPPIPQASDFSARVDNPWYPLIAGTTYVYRGVKDGHPARDVITVTHRIRTIDGVHCRVVEDRLYLSGYLGERTTEWYSQDKQGNVWYFGEDTAELARDGHVTTTSGTWRGGNERAALVSFTKGK